MFAERVFEGQSFNDLGERIWVVGGRTDDLFYNDAYAGCRSFRESLECWATKEAVEIIVVVDENGVESFAGCKGSEHAKDILKNAQPNRASKYGNRRNKDRAESPQGEEEKTRQAAENAAQAAGGVAQQFQNTFTKLQNLITHKETRSLVIIEGFSYFFNNKLANQEATAILAQDLRRQLQVEWPKLTMKNLVVFTSKTAEDFAFMKTIYTPGDKPIIRFKSVEGPGAKEIQLALERLALRKDIRFQYLGKICELLEKQGELRMAVKLIMKVFEEKKAQKPIAIADVLKLPAVNEEMVDEVLRELDGLTGLEEVKTAVADLVKVAKEMRRKLETHGELPVQTRHLVFSGNAGTGKTTVARLVARLFYALGVLSKAEIVETSPDQLKSSNVGESAENMQAKIQEALGGVLFIDEAHQLAEDGHFSKELIQPLVKASWDERHRLVIILAGYERQMHGVYRLDEGLNRRFPENQRLVFRDYTVEQLLGMFTKEMQKRRYRIAEGLLPRIRNLIAAKAKKKTFYNAGGVVNLAQEIESRHLALGDEGHMITAQDLPSLVKPNEEVLTQAQAMLDSRCGQQKIKKYIDDIKFSYQYNAKLERSGKAPGKLDVNAYNLILSGPPGTGKTTAADIITDLLYGLGALEKQSCLTLTRSSLVGKFQGHTAAQVREQIEKGRGGVIFIDEVYALMQGEHDSFGKEAVDELVGQITKAENSGTLFILAGYEDKIDRFLAVNEGLKRRFPRRIELQRFSPEECAALFAAEVKKEGDIVLAEGVLEEVKRTAQREMGATGDSFGNAGWVVDVLFQQALANMKKRICEEDIDENEPGFFEMCCEDINLDNG